MTWRFTITGTVDPAALTSWLERVYEPPGDPLPEGCEEATFRDFASDALDVVKGELGATPLEERFGVSENSILRALDDEYRERQNACSNRSAESRRQPCVDGCGRLVWTHSSDTGACPDCNNKRRAKPLEHGTESGYKKGCRLACCRGAATAARRARRQRVEGAGS